MRLFIVTLVVLVLITAPATADTKVALDGDNTKIKFVGSKADGKHEGGFKTVTGTATATGDATTLKISIDIDTTSLYSDDMKLTGHLKSPDFFAVKKYPKARFVTTKVASATSGYTVTGDLTMLGKTKSVSFPAKITLGDSAVSLSASFKINRSDWGMTFGKGKVDEAVSLTVSVDARK
jgi:polyisoprenoid-binding protein YceI